MGCELMVNTMASQEGNWDRCTGGWRGMFRDCDWRRWLSPRGINTQGGDRMKIRKRFETCAAYDGDQRRAWEFIIPCCDLDVFFILPLYSPGSESEAIL